MERLDSMESRFYDEEEKTAFESLIENDRITDDEFKGKWTLRKY